MFKNGIKKLSVLLTLFLILSYVMPTIIFAFGPSDDVIYQGIDVSGYQGDIDYAKVKKAGIDIVYMKTSEGPNYIDSKFERNYKEAKANGLKVGFYHYVTARTEMQAVREAIFFVSVIANKVPDCRLAMDFESFGSLSKTEINKIGLAFMRKVEELTGLEMVLYSNASTANNTWAGEITKYPLWVAQYGVRVPENNGNWQTWVGWQYTDMGDVSGISNYVDRNQFTKGILLSNTSEIPKPTEPMPDDPDKPDEPDKPSNPDNPDIPQKTTTITIKRGDTLSALAVKYNTTVAKLVELNNIKNPNLIYAGNKLIVPVNNSSLPIDTEVYTVKRGDTLSEIAQRFDTTVQKIAKDNNISNVNLIYTGQKLIIPMHCRYDCGHKIYEVLPGDTLSEIAQMFNTTVASIVKLNKSIKNPNLIYPGQMLRIR